MALPEKVTQIGSDLFNKLIFGSLTIVVVAVLVGVILGVGLYVRYLRKFNVVVHIKSVRSRGEEGQPIYKLSQDKGGTFYSKRDKTWAFKVRAEKIQMPVPPLECYEMDYRGVNHVNILQKSTEEYCFMLPSKIDTTVIIRNGISIPVAQQNLKIVEGDVAYWNQLRKRQNKQIFDIEGIVMKLLPYIIPALMIIGVIFYTYIWLDQSGTIAGMTQENLRIIKQVTENLLQISQAQTAG